MEKITVKGIIGDFYAALAAQAAGWDKTLGFMAASNQKEEEYAWLGSAPAAREWLGERLPKALREVSYKIRNKLWEASIGISRDDFRRDKTGQIQARIKDMATRYGAHWRRLMSTLILGGETALCYDGDYFFGTAHAEGDSGTQKNLLTYSEVPNLEVTTTTAPTPIEMANAALGVIQYMLGYKDDSAEPINEEANGFVIMVPVPFGASAVQMATLDVLTNTTAAVQNPIRNAGYNIQVVVNPRLTWTTDFAVFRSDGSLKPFILQEELPVSVEVLDENSEYAIQKNQVLFGTKASSAAGYGLWQHAAKATFH